LSSDGNTLAVGAYFEDSSALGIDGTQSNDAASASGAVYTFRRNASAWTQQAYVKAPNTGASHYFGRVVAFSGDGTVLAVGADGEDTSTFGVGGVPGNSDAWGSGAVYLYH
jgi:hypothetical protein